MGVHMCVWWVCCECICVYFAVGVYVCECVRAYCRAYVNFVSTVFFSKLIASKNNALS